MRTNKRVNPLAPPVKKAAKRRITYAETYNKGTIATNRAQVISYIKKAEFLFLNRLANYDDGTQSCTFTIEIKKDVADKINKES
jgi:hypothetical protein